MHLLLFAIFCGICYFRSQLCDFPYLGSFLPSSKKIKQPVRED